jgi:hypothetical protein
MEERHPIWRATANTLTADSRQAVVLQLGGLERFKQILPMKNRMLRITLGEMLPLETKQSGGK